MNAWRAFGNGLLTLITKIGSGYWHITDPQNGYTVIFERSIEALDLDSIYTYYGYCNDLLIKLNAFGLQTIDVPMPARYGRETSTIRYGTYIRKVAPMIFRGFLWRLKMKYIVFDFHPLGSILYCKYDTFTSWIFVWAMDYYSKTDICMERFQQIIRSLMYLFLLWVCSYFSLLCFLTCR